LPPLRAHARQGVVPALQVSLRRIDQRAIVFLGSRVVQRLALLPQTAVCQISDGPWSGDGLILGSNFPPTRRHSRLLALGGVAVRPPRGFRGPTVASRGQQGSRPWAWRREGFRRGRLPGGKGRCCACGVTPNAMGKVGESRSSWPLRRTRTGPTPQSHSQTTQTRRESTGHENRRSALRVSLVLARRLTTAENRLQPCAGGPWCESTWIRLFLMAKRHQNPTAAISRLGMSSLTPNVFCRRSEQVLARRH